MAALFVDQLTVIDCAVLDPARGLVGTSWIVDLTLTGTLDDQGMICDFGPAKRTVKRGIDDIADHKLIVPQHAPGLHCHDDGGRAEITFTDQSGDTLRLRCPLSALMLLDAETAAPDTAAAALQEALAGSLGSNVATLSLRLRDEAISGAHYRYCHGLRKHAGNCQRIAHGHRSRLEIEVNGTRDTALEQRWAARWQDIFLGNRADLVNDPADTRYHFAYTADQGRFELELPAARCALLEADTTVENIAAHIADTLKREQPQHRFTVRAWEGVNKGAVAGA